MRNEGGDESQAAPEAQPVEKTSGPGLPNTVEVSKLSIKPPTFVPSEPDLFFIQIEAQFYHANITQDFTKYNHVVASLDPKYITMVSDLVRNPPMFNKYDTLKSRLITEYSQSDQARLRVLLNELQLGDMKPSHLLRRMRDTARNAMSEDVLKSLWLDRLPENIRATVAVSNDNLTTCAVLADKIFELVKPNILAEVKTVQTPQLGDNDLAKQIHALTKRLDQLDARKPRSKFFNPNNKNRSRSNSKNKHPYCKYHYKFGAMAQKCIQPCRFQNVESTEKAKT